MEKLKDFYKIQVGGYKDVSIIEKINQVKSRMPKVIKKVEPEKVKC
jgi:hypothetical protein